MPYEIILDNEVDPGSQITHSLIRRLRDNPYLVVPDIAVDGSIGIKAKAKPATSTNPAINTVWDNPPWSIIYAPGGSALVVTMATSIAVCPRNAPFAAGLPINPLGHNQINRSHFDLAISEFWNGVSGNRVTTAVYCSLVYSGGTPTKVAFRAMTGSPIQTIAPGRSPTFSGPLGTGTYYELDIGAGFVELMRVADVYMGYIEASATIDLDTINIKFRATKDNSAGVTLQAYIDQESWIRLSDSYRVSEIQLVKA